MRVSNIIMNLLSLVLVAAGLGLIGTFFLGSPFSATGVAGEVSVSGITKNEFNVPVLREEDEPRPAGAGADPLEQANVPTDKTLRITIPKMARVRDAEIPYTTGDDEEELRNNTAIHLKGTGFPWEKEANVYIAGHRLGYLNTNSFLAFYDLNVLEKGDEFFLTDSTGKKYVYRVFKERVVEPTDVYVTHPVKGKNIVTLQTCTLPDYSRRLIVQAEKVS